MVSEWYVQGADGDNFYVVESGTFGVLVDTGN
jgi:CRP-like cAMP-binding protein